MATANRRLFCNWYNKTLQISDRNSGTFVLPPFNKYETIPFEIVIVEPDLTATGFDRFQRVDISNLSLSVALNDNLDDASLLAYQPVFTKDEENNVFSGELSLNTAAFNAYLTSADTTKSAYFEIEMQEGTARSKIYVAQVTLQNSPTIIGNETPTPVDEYYTKAQVEQQFVKKVMPAGESITMTTPDGTKQIVIQPLDDGTTTIQWFDV